MLLESGSSGQILRLPEAHDKKEEALSCYDLTLCTGAKTREGAEARAPVGSWAVFDGEPRQLDGDIISTPYADNIAGCITVLLAMERLKKPVGWGKAALARIICSWRSAGRKGRWPPMYSRSAKSTMPRCAG